jgi:predicted nucleic-acid-binding Zn-ribbon protein
MNRDKTFRLYQMLADIRTALRCGCDEAAERELDWLCSQLSIDRIPHLCERPTRTSKECRQTGYTEWQYAD